MFGDTEIARSYEHITHFRHIIQRTSSSNLGPRAGLLNIKERTWQKNTDEDKMEIKLECFKATKYETV